MDTQMAYNILKQHRGELTRQQICTIKGQIKAGDTDGAIKGMARLLSKKEK